jgi:NitT/TauT family transport system ATP-binding protein
MREICTPPQIEFDKAAYSGRFRDSPAITIPSISLRIDGGEFFSIVCPACTARKILVRMIAGLIPPTAGDVLIAGKKAASCGQDLGIVFEEPSLLGWRTLLENALLEVELRRMDSRQGEDQARRLFAAVGLSGYEDRMPHAVPAGLAQRAALCRALVHNPSLLLMEDPFNSLDGLDREQAAVDLQRLGLAQKVTAVLFTADIREAVQLSDRVAVMARDGRIIEPISIDLARPRRMDKATTPRIAEYCSNIRTILHATGVLS